MIKVSFGDLIEVVWEDIVADAEWHTVEEVKKIDTALCNSVGFVIHQTPKKLWLCDTIGSNSDYGGTIVFPKCVIRKIKKIRRYI